MTDSEQSVEPKGKSESVFVQQDKNQRRNSHEKVRLIERVPEEGHEVDYTRRVEIDKQIAPENVTCFQDIWMEDDIMTSGRKIMTGLNQEQHTL